MGYSVHIDGGSRGNPGPSALGVVVTLPDGNDLLISKFIGQATNNEAEYSALLTALEYVLSYGDGTLTVNSDSLLLVRQMQGKYGVNSSKLQPFYQKAKELCGKIGNVTFIWIPREQNTLADKLVNEALDDYEKNSTPKIAGETLSSKLHDELGC